MQTPWYAGQPLSSEIAALKLFISEDQLRLCHRKPLSSLCPAPDAGFERFDSSGGRDTELREDEMIRSGARPCSLVRTPRDITASPVTGEGY